MNELGFRSLLARRKVSAEMMEPAIAMAQRFERSLEGKEPTAETAWDFSKVLIAEGKNTFENYVTLIRYCLFIKNNEMFTAFMELVDGGEVGENFYRMVAEQFGDKVCEEIFAGLSVAPFGLPTPEKPKTIHPALERLQALVGDQATRDFLSACLRDLPDESFLDERVKYQQAGSIDTYLEQRKDAFLAELEACLREERPFFAQEITKEVIDFVRSEPEMGGGRRVGDIVYETKIPFLTRQYLAERDPTLKRYYACHCPWVRESLRRQSTRLVEDFCYCSGGFHKKAFEVIFAQPLKVDVLESALKGNLRCRFAIHLPEELVR